MNSIKQDKLLSVPEYLELFTSLESSCRVPRLPEGGRIYLFGTDNPDEQNDWKSDQYRWRQSGKAHEIECGEHVVRKTYFYTIVGYEGEKILTNKNFARYVYTCNSFPNKVLIHYYGDHELANLELPHRNAKHSNRRFVNTKQSVILKMKRHPGPPNKAYKQLINEAPRELNRHPAEAPRNLSQVQNIMKLRKKNLSYNQCSLWGLSMISTSLGEFVRKIRIHKDIEIICTHPDNLKILQMLLSCKKDTHSVKSVGLFYDTTFKCGEFYLSMLSFTEIEFDPSPIIPVLFFIHERKFEETHGRFWKRVAKEIPGLRKAKNVYIVTDEEHAITNSIEKNFPDTDRFLCQNHLKQNAKRYLSSLRLKRDPWAHYKDDLEELFSFETRQEYDRKLPEYIGKWNSGFQQFFLKRIHPVIDLTGRWALSKHGLTSITTNAAESVNATLKRLMEWKEVTIDAMVLILFQLSSSMYDEIFRGHYGIGNFKILPEFGRLYCLVKDKPMLPKIIYDPEEIVQRVRNGEQLYQEFMDNKNYEEVKVPDDQCEQQDDSSSDVRCDIKYALALDVLKTKRVYLDLESRCFVVQGPARNYFVNLFPKRKCQCGSTTTCYHILAAEMCVGIQESGKKNPGNAMLLRKRARKNADKLPGRKKPRVNDVKPSPHLDNPNEDEISDGSDFDDGRNLIQPTASTLLTAKKNADKLPGVRKKPRVNDVKPSPSLDNPNEDKLSAGSDFDDEHNLFRTTAAPSSLTAKKHRKGHGQHLSSEHLDYSAVPKKPSTSIVAKHRKKPSPHLDNPNEDEISDGSHFDDGRNLIQPTAATSSLTAKKHCKEDGQHLSSEHLVSPAGTQKPATPRERKYFRRSSLYLGNPNEDGLSAGSYFDDGRNLIQATAEETSMLTKAFRLKRSPLPPSATPLACCRNNCCEEENCITLQKPIEVDSTAKQKPASVIATPESEEPQPGCSHWSEGESTPFEISFESKYDFELLNPQQKNCSVEQSIDSVESKDNHEIIQINGEVVKDHINTSMVVASQLIDGQNTYSDVSEEKNITAPETSSVLTLPEHDNIHPTASSSLLTEKDIVKGTSLVEDKQSTSHHSHGDSPAKQSVDSKKYVSLPRSKRAIHSRGDEYLTEDEISAITETSWLRSSHINAASTLLRQTNQTVNGLFKVQPAYQSVKDKFAQILNTGENHWVLVVRGFNDSFSGVQLYDSLRAEKRPSLSVQNNIAQLCKSQDSSIRIYRMECQKQANFNDCGFFAIAFACAILNGINPASIEFDHSKLRSHLKQCFTNKRITPFPSRPLGNTADEDTFKLFKFQVYCVCRLPSKFGQQLLSTKKGAKRDDDMTCCDTCDLWYHRKCLQIPNKIFTNPNEKWVCRKCKKKVVS